MNKTLKDTIKMVITFKVADERDRYATELREQGYNPRRVNTQDIYNKIYYSVEWEG